MKVSRLEMNYIIRMATCIEKYYPVGSFTEIKIDTEEALAFLNDISDDELANWDLIPNYKNRTFTFDNHNANDCLLVLSMYED